MKSLVMRLVLTHLCLFSLLTGCDVGPEPFADSGDPIGTTENIKQSGNNSPLVNGKYVPLDAAYLKPNSWGIYTWGPTKKINAADTPYVVGLSKNLRWSEVEPKQGKYNFNNAIGSTLKKAQENDFYVILMIWVAAANDNVTPKWLYNECKVPRVLTNRGVKPTGEPEGNITFPYYLDAKYIEKYNSLIRAFGNYLDALPDHLHKRILFVQVAEGSTGDGQPYKGDPIKGYEKYQITKEKWSQFRINAWRNYKKYLMDRPARKVPLLMNADSNREVEDNWLLNNMPYLGVKNGMFSHGWHISDGAQRRAESLALTQTAELTGMQTFVRGEMDAELFVYGWSTRHIPRALYTSAQYALHNGLDLWNIPSEALLANKNRPAFEFFNKYAGHRNPRLAPAAFCALRKGLDASNAVRYPANRFGTAKKTNISRYLAILKQFFAYGAVQKDPPKATGGGMKNRKRSNYNDVGWGIIPGNYYRFLKQIKPATGRGWWHQGPENSIYSQFGRSFVIKNNKGAMYFQLHPHFLKANNQPVSLKMRIVYLDRGTGKWSFHYSSPGKMKSAFSVKNTNTEKWKEFTYQIADFTAGGKLVNGADFILKYDGGDDTIFHMIEIDRQ